MVSLRFNITLSLILSKMDFFCSCSSFQRRSFWFFFTNMEQDLLYLTCGAGSAYPPGAPEIIPSFWWGSCCLFFSFLCCFMCTNVCIFVFFIFSHDIVSLFSIYEFDCPSGIFRLSFSKSFGLLWRDVSLAIIPRLLFYLFGVSG